ncbi:MULTISPECIES: TetR/AcrR family transcriptional regulator [Frankia]|uniref:TetR family transcriptional regulator n=1 Tax=Frankia alni (strain DSM 45986 / CECT 9034 / ACN14a) TaxID=326424 RepID=Q0RJ23_FRAAA|nr:MULTISPECIES: TetR/AcrR family transcriptional regulator [Frankia]CAJ62492.1 putative TetR family transcriptional regulator [Frankia alni ACN14a]
MPAHGRTRPLRADARRNRDQVLDAALRAFSAGGPGVPLEAVARDAGVGIATLYRHFPTREVLVEAVYRAELGRLCDAAPALLGRLPPAAALRAWMDAFLDYTTAKRGMADALRAVIASGGDPFAHTRKRMVAAVTSLLAAGDAAGTVRADVDPVDVLTGLAGVTLAAGEPAQRAQAGRLLDLFMDGLRPRATPPGRP